MVFGSIQRYIDSMPRSNNLMFVSLFLPGVSFGSISSPGLEGSELTDVRIERVWDDRGRLRKLSFDDGSGVFRAWAELTRGQLVFFIRTRHDGTRSSALYGRDVVRISLREFGPGVRVIEGRWTDGANRVQYDAARAAKASKRAAAATTWTGRTLAEHGYTRIGPVRLSKLYPGTTRVDCSFRRPFAVRGAEVASRLQDFCSGLLAFTK